MNTDLNFEHGIEGMFSSERPAIFVILGENPPTMKDKNLNFKTYV
jgi:hypothetical protein